MRVWAFLAVALAVSPAAAAERCDGRYEQVAEMVDAAIAKYGTLYSGGTHWHALDDIGATLDLYRLWRGLPDLKLRAARRSGNSLDFHGGDAAFREGLARALDVVEGQQAPDETERVTTAIRLDLATSLAKPADWWRAPDQAAELTESQRIVAAMAAERPSLDWLQSVTAASDAPWVLAWHLDRDDAERANAYERLIADALGKAGDRIEWGVVAQLFWHPVTAHGEALTQMARDWESRVQSCEASPAEYAAYAATAPVSGRYTGLVRSAERLALLPPSVRDALARNAALQTMVRGPSATLKEELAALARANPDPAFLRWLDVARSYTASSVDELIAIHAGKEPDAKSVRVFNLLAVGDLQRMALSGELSPRTEAMVLKAVVARHAALGHWSEARRLLPILADKLAATQSTETLAPLPKRLPDDVVVALAISRMPGLSTWMVGWGESDFGLALFNSYDSRNLPAAFADGQAVQGDFETWLLLPQKWYRFHGLHGIEWSALERVYVRAKSLRDDTIDAPKLFLPLADGSGFCIARLAAFDELRQLLGERNLVRQVSLTLLKWADSTSEGLFKSTLSTNELPAEALHRVVMMNRTANGGEVDGQAIGKRAFTLLHKRFPFSPWTRKTPYWYDVQGQ